MRLFAPLRPRRVSGGAAFFCLALWMQVAILPLLVLGIAGGPAVAEETGNPASLTLEEAIKIGLEKNPRIAMARSQIDASNARVTQSLSGLYPRVDFSESFTRTNNPAQAFSFRLNQERITTRDFDPARLNDPSSINNFAGTLSMSMPIYDAGQIRIGVSQARLGQESASLAADRVRQEVITGVVAAYANVLLAQDQLEVIHQTLETAKASEKIIRSRLQSGLVVRSDLLRAEVRIAELEQERLHARSLVYVAKASLSAAMGVESDALFNLVPLELKGSNSPGVLDRWVQTAVKSRPDLKEIRHREVIADQEVKKARMAHLPGLYLAGNYELDSEDFDQIGSNYTLGIVLRANLFSGFGIEGRVQEALATLRQVKAAARQLELAVGVETRRAFSLAQSAFDRIRVAEAALDQAEEGLRIVRSRYENGLFTIVNLLDAEAALQQARTLHLRSLYDHKVAMAQLHLAAGIIEESFR
jgi:outer membrane protein